MRTLIRFRVSLLRSGKVAYSLYILCTFCIQTYITWRVFRLFWGTIASVKVEYKGTYSSYRVTEILSIRLNPEISSNRFGP